jgi:hypothetical protein
MAAVKKAAKSKKTSIAKKKVTKQPAIKKAVVKNTAAKKSVVKKKAAKPVVKKAAVKKNAVKPAVKKKAVKSMKKTAARPVVKNKDTAKAVPVVSKSKELRATVAALKQKIKDLKSELKNIRKRADAVAGLSGKRDAAVEKFLKGWDKKAMSALEKSLQPKKKKKSKK